MSSSRFFVALLVAIAPIACFSGTAAGQAPTPMWIRQFGTAAADFVHPHNPCAPDGAGGIVIGGSTEGSLCSTNAGGEDAFLVRYNSSGSQAWCRQFGTDDMDRIYIVAPAGAGGVFAAGLTRGSLCPQCPNAGGADDAFVVRYDGAGAQQWVHQFGSKGGSEGVRGLAADGGGGGFVGGHTSSDLFSPNAGGNDAFILRLSGAGDQAWAQQFGTAARDEVTAIVHDGFGGVYVTGITEGSLFAPHADHEDPFLARFSTDGSLVWGVQLGSEQPDAAWGLAVDAEGGVYVAGQTFGPMGTPLGGGDAFLARFDGAGNLQWLRQIGTDGTDSSSALSPDGVGGVLLAGSTTGDLGGANAGNWDAFLTRYDPAGDRTWIRQFGTPTEDHGYFLSLDATGGSYFGGITQGNLGGPNLGGWDVYLLRLTGACYADCNSDGSLSVADFGCFQSKYVLGCP